MGEAGIWATCNIGASKPEETGDYFGWGGSNPVNIATKENFDDAKTKWSDDNYYQSHDVLKLEDDTAHIKMGGNWRMPTKEEFQKLIDLCDISYNDKTITFSLKTNPSTKLVFPRSGGYQNIYWSVDTGVHYKNFYVCWTSSFWWDEDSWAYNI